ncbi:MLP family protein, partial [Clostridium perfringens]|nr:MLP family protein [Clostridium perfringens]
HKVPTATSRNIQAVALHEGDWHTHGAIKIWNYTIDGKPEVFKEKVEFDDANMTFYLHGLEGDLFKDLKVYRPIWKIVPKNKGSVAKIALEYERMNEDAPIPNTENPRIRRS